MDTYTPSTQWRQSRLPKVEIIPHTFKVGRVPKSFAVFKQFSATSDSVSMQW